MFPYGYDTWNTLEGYDDIHALVDSNRDATKRQQCCATLFMKVVSVLEIIYC